MIKTRPVRAKYERININYDYISEEKYMDFIARWRNRLNSEQEYIGTLTTDQVILDLCYNRTTGLLARIYIINSNTDDLVEMFETSYYYGTVELNITTPLLTVPYDAIIRTLTSIIKDVYH